MSIHPPGKDAVLITAFIVRGGSLWIGGGYTEFEEGDLHDMEALVPEAARRFAREPRRLGISDFNWERHRLRVASPKTGDRYMPIFPELAPLLLEVIEDGATNAQHPHRRVASVDAPQRRQASRHQGMASAVAQPPSNSPDRARGNLPDAFGLCLDGQLKGSG